MGSGELRLGKSIGIRGVGVRGVGVAQVGSGVGAGGDRVGFGARVHVRGLGSKRSEELRVGSKGLQLGSKEFGSRGQVGIGEVGVGAWGWVRDVGIRGWFRDVGVRGVGVGWFEVRGWGRGELELGGLGLGKLIGIRKVGVEKLESGRLE